MAEAPRRPTHFLAVRLLHPALHDFGRAVQASIRQAFPELASGFTSTDKLHITLGVLSLSSDDEILQARASLRSFVAESLTPLLQSGRQGKPRISFRENSCLGSFPGSRKAINVLYIQPFEASHDGSASSSSSPPLPQPLPLRTLSALAMHAVGNAVLKVDATTNQPIPDPSFEPHATLWKQSKMGRRANSKPSRDARVALRHSLESLVFWDRGAATPSVETNPGRSVQSKGVNRNQTTVLPGAKSRRVEAAARVTDVVVTTEQRPAAEAAGESCEEASSHAACEAPPAKEFIAREMTTDVIAIDPDGGGFTASTSRIESSQSLSCAYDWPRDEQGLPLEVVEEIHSVLLCSMVRPGPRRGSHGSAEADVRLGTHEGFGLHPEIDGFYFVEEEVPI